MQLTPPKSFAMICRQIFMLILSTACIDLFSQNIDIDVVRLKSGKVYKGAIIESKPDSLLKIQNRDGVFIIRADEIERVTTEPGKQKSIVPKYESPPQRHKSNRMRSEWKPAEKGYFLQAQISGEIAGGNKRFVNGYKFNRFAYLGFATGVDYVLFSISEVATGRVSHYSEGLYVPMLAHFSGNILNRKKTPFYTAEFGYNLGLPVLNNISHGFNAMLGVGFKVYGGSRFSFSVLPHCAIRYRVSYITMRKHMTDEAFTVKTKNTFITPGLRICFGFN